MASSEDLRSEIERLNRDLDLANSEINQSAKYGLGLLEEKQSLQSKCEELENLFENTKHELEITQEVSLNYVYSKIYTYIQKKSWRLLKFPNKRLTHGHLIIHLSVSIQYNKFFIHIFSIILHNQIYELMIREQKFNSNKKNSYGRGILFFHTV